MENNKNQPGQNLSPEEQLDQLLAEFLTDGSPADSAPAAEQVPQQPDALEDAPLLADENDNFSSAETMPEIGPDEAALAYVGLTQSADVELEKIIEEIETEPQPAVAEASTVPQVQAAEAAGDAPVVAPESNEPAQPGETAAAEAEEAESQEDMEKQNTGKRRPKRKGAYGLFGLSHILSTVIWLGIIAFIGIGLGRMVWEVAADVLALDRPEQSVTITITDEDDLDDVAQKLQQTGLIKYSGLFKLYGNITDCMDSIRPGTFNLSTQYDYHALVNSMSSNQHRLTTTVVIPEGYNCAQIFALLEQKGVCSAAKLEEAAANADLGDYWFLEGVERGTPYCLEGYLFPDTYNFYYSHDPDEVLRKFLNNFDRRYTDIMKGKLDILNENLSNMMRNHGLSEQYIASHQMTIREVVIVASMIEKETANYSESYNISSVIYNRLTNPAVYPYLNIDAALVYATGRSPITNEDKLLDTPYNTYLYKGLIPGPISNPGQASLDAALDPEMTEYHYYAFDPSTGVHHFSKTLAEHNQFLESLRNSEG